MVIGPLTHVSGELKRALAVAQYEYQTITFGAADTDFDIKFQHLTPPPGSQVNYEVVGSDRAALVYHDQSATARPWPAGVIILRCNAADAVVRLRLTVEP